MRRWESLGYTGQTGTKTDLKQPGCSPTLINRNENIYSAFISPDKSYLIGCVENRNSESNPGVAN